MIPPATPMFTMVVIGSMHLECLFSYHHTFGSNRSSRAVHGASKGHDAAQHHQGVPPCHDHERRDYPPCRSRAVHAVAVGSPQETVACFVEQWGVPLRFPEGWGASPEKQRGRGGSRLRPLSAVQGLTLSHQQRRFLARPYPTPASIGVLSPRRISNFMVPSGCMIRAITGSAGATGISDWCAPLGRITVLHPEGAITTGDAVPGATASRSSSRPLRFPTCQDSDLVIALKSSKSSISPLTGASIADTFLSSAVIRSSRTPVSEISILVISISR